MGFYRRYLDCGIGQIHATMVEGPRDGRKPLVMLNSRARSLLKLMKLLEDKYYCVLLDIPGFGLSSPTPTGSSMSDVANSVLEAVDALDLKAPDFFAIHTGHKIVSCLAADHPDRVNRLALMGKTHSLVPGHQERNAAMQGYIAARAPDVLLVSVEGNYIDDSEHGVGNEAMYAANFAYDFAAAMARIEANTLLIEVTSPQEDALYGRVGGKLVAPMKNGRAIAVDQIEAVGLELYVGQAKVAEILREFLA